MTLWENTYTLEEWQQVFLTSI